MNASGPHTGKAKCLPTYLLMDTSGTMKVHEKTLNDTLEHVYLSLVENPRVSEFAHISIISFNTQPHLVLEMTDIEEIQQIPALSCGGLTNFGAAFDLLHERINIDIPARRSAGMAVLRPAVFILTDGLPTDGNTWAARFAALVDPTWSRRPHVITFGFGDATSESLGSMATKAAFRAKDNLHEKDALTSMLTTLLNTLVASAPAGELIIPKDLPGFERVPVDYVE
ncbi:MAG: vWA domain-containing protein [Pseudonocardiaceae bacterium]